MANEPFPADFFASETLKESESPDRVRPSPQQSPQNIQLGGGASPTEDPKIATFQAIEAHFLAIRAKAVVNLNNYLENPAGIGEHPDIVAECIKLVEDIDHSESVIGTLRRAQK